MASSEPSRGKSDAPGRNHRDQVPALAPNLTPLDNGPGSLRSRISDKETPRQGQRSPYPSRKDDRDSRKRPFNERDKDNTEMSGQIVESGPPKRPRLIRDRYATDQSSGHGSGSARKVDPQAGDRNGR
ncbi:hypothetical protein K435DRAFT_105364 [Dendrothele bispora CBS 962.96]|uniref:Uncharacterized protein n=1 Tax=Dendrothele bispora (strain CBS 962.96) TaxID=1314807 RepID=A0A4S8MQT0_DENBC|nr:hypothetical protein K435DRAFT_105364 [Dendrothele bispora CBS 962.96]